MADDEYDDEQELREQMEALSVQGREFNPYTDCRMYENEFPEVDDLVMVRVTKVTDIGAYVNMLEYNNKEGIILLSNLSRKRIRSVNRHVRVGKVEVLQVLRVDRDKGYVDLSKKLIQKDDIVECQERFKKSKTVHSILSRVAQNNSYPLLQLYEKIGWPLSRKHGHAHDAFQLMVQDESLMPESDVPEEVKADLLKVVRHRLAIHPVKVQADIEVTCFTYEGIEAVKPALQAGLDRGTEQEFPVKIQLFSTPLYLMYIITPDREHGVQTLEKMIEAVKEKIEASGGNLAIKVAPRVVQAA
jgi:translation initiation factor 2 subunit 1